MLIRPIQNEEHDAFNKVVTHPLQSWEWGELRRTTGIDIERIGFFEGKKLHKAFQVFFHKLPIMGLKVGYFPKGPMPDDEQLSVLRQLAKKHNALFVKMEPNLAAPVGAPSGHVKIAEFLQEHEAVPGRPLFTKYTYILDLSPSEDELFAQLANKTRYNVNVAYKRGVQIVEDTTESGMEEYIKVLEETTKRQQFYAHTPEYFRTMWKTLGNSGMLRIFHATLEGQILVSWVLFSFNNMMYYPYGASRSLHRDAMPSNLMMWEMIRLAKQEGCRAFDMWGALGPDANDKDPFFGFHRFKKGYGGTLSEFVGTFDLVTQGHFYPIFRTIENWRWKLLRLKAKLRL